jgi:hypothetical protein
LLQARLRALGPGALTGAILTQLALLPGSPRWICGGLAALALGWGILRARRVPRPELAAVGAYLDARLGQGAVLAAAAEALGGSHGRFRAPLVLEAAERLHGAGSQANVPWRLSPAWGLALAATALSPLSLSSAPPPPGPSLGSRSLLDPTLLAGGGGGQPEVDGPAAEPSDARYGLSGAGADEAGAEILELPLDVVAALARAAGPQPGGGEGSSQGGGEAGASQEESILAKVAAEGLEGALQEIEELKAAAAGGDRTARVQLGRLRQALARASGGGGGAGAPTSAPPRPVEGGGSTPHPATGAGGEALPASLAGALERYFGE